MPAGVNNSPELTLLLTIARVELEPGEKRVLNDLLAGPLDWEYLLLMAARHGLEPLLFLHLHSFAEGDCACRDDAGAARGLQGDCRAQPDPGIEA